MNLIQIYSQIWTQKWPPSQYDGKNDGTVTHTSYMHG